MAQQKYPKLWYSVPFDEREQFEAQARGWLSHVQVEDTDGSIYDVTFYDPVRLAQDLEYEVETGRMCVADVGMIVLPEVTLQNIETAVARLSSEGYFSSFRPTEKRAGK